MQTVPLKVNGCTHALLYAWGGGYVDTHTYMHNTLVYMCSLELEQSRVKPINAEEVLCPSIKFILFKKQMLQGANIDLFNPLVPKAHNCECQILLIFPLQIKPVKVN